MMIFRRKTKETDLALNYLHGKLTEHLINWQKTLKLTLGAEAASQQPIEKVKPFVRDVWIDCYVRAMEMNQDIIEKHKLVRIATPEIDSVLSLGQLDEAISHHARKMGELLGDVVRKIGELSPSHKEALLAQIEDPELSQIKKEAKAIFKQKWEQS